MTLVAVESCHAAGKSTLVRAAAAALGWRAYHHPAPPRELLDDAVGCALHYAAARRVLFTTWRDDVNILADRWSTSSEVIALRPGSDGLLSRAIHEIVSAEAWAMPVACLPRATILLDADGLVLDARLRTRWAHDGTFDGMPPHEVERAIAAKLSRERSERSIYRSMAAMRKWPVVCSDAGKLDEVTEELVRVVREIAK